MKRMIALILAAALALTCMAIVSFAAPADNTYNGETIDFSEWTNAAFGSWEQREDGTIAPTELTDFTLLRLEKNLGNEYTIEMDVKQEDLDSGWQTINIGFDVKEGENFTQSGFTLDLHNAGVARVINYGSANMGASKEGSYDNPYGGSAAYAANTDWMHVKIQRKGADFTVTIHNGTEITISFQTEAYNGGYLVLGAVGNRMVSYKNIRITSTETYLEFEEDPRAISEETEGGVNTCFGEAITLDDWSATGDSEWVEQNGIYYTKDLAEYSVLTLNRDLGKTYTIELDVRQHQVSTGWNCINIGFDVNEGEDLTTSGLTIDLHNAGVWRIIDFKDRNNKEVAIGNYDNPFGGDDWTYSCTTQWMHVTIERMNSYYNVTLNDGTEKVIRFETDDYNGGHLCISSVGKRDIMFKNIKIIDEVTSMAADDPVYPETIGSTEYTFAGNSFGEWTVTEGWTANGNTLSAVEADTEQIAYLDLETMRNFRLSLNYEVLSENGGVFGVAFRKKSGGASYQGIGYSLIFKLSEDGNSMTLADYTTSGAAGLDGMAHEFELAGNVTLTASGNEFCVWLNDELILNVTSNSYAFGSLGLYAQNCAVSFSDIKLTSDALLPDVVWDAIDAINEGTQITAEMQTQLDALTEFEKSLIPSNILAQFDNAHNTSNGDIWLYVGIAAAVVLAAAAVCVVIIKKKKTQK